MEDERVTEPVAPKKRGRPAGSTAKATAAPAKRAASKKTDYTPQLLELVDTAASVPLGIGVMKGSQILLADGYAIKHHGANIAKAVNDLAQNKPEVAMALERLGQSTPYAALVMAVVPLALQLAANHIPKFAGLPMTHSVEDLAGAALQEMGIEVTDESTED